MVKAGYGVYSVDEFRTSCRCSACGGEFKTFRVCENPRPCRTGSILRHGLVKCKDLLDVVKHGHERRVQHLEDSRERDSRRSATGLPPTSQKRKRRKRLTQWCYVGYHPTTIYASHHDDDFGRTVRCPSPKKSSFAERKRERMEFRFNAPGTKFRCKLQCVRCTGKTASGRCEQEVCIGTPLCSRHLRATGLEIRDSEIKGAGKGLFACQYRPHMRYIFPKGSPIVRMHSQQITNAELLARYGRYTAPYGIKDNARIEDGACLRGIGMLANSASEEEANAEYRMHNKVFWVFATKDIAHGDEILVSYGTQYELDESGVTHETVRIAGTRATALANEGGRLRSARAQTATGSDGSDASKASRSRTATSRRPPDAPTLRVGERVSVYWPTFQKEFQGTVESLRNKDALVKYKDGSYWHKNLAAQFL
jgi:hypothetical protein